MAATWGGLDGGLICVYGMGWSWFVWVCLFWVDLGCGLIWVCVEAWRHGDDGVLIGVDFSLCGLIDVG